MIGEGFLLFVLVGTSYAAYLDLESGEVPDLVSIVVAAGGIVFHGYLALMQGSITPLVDALLVGTGLFLIGWLAYMMGVWGGADAFVLGAVGFALPQLPPGIAPVYTAPWPFPFSLVLTVLLVGAVYSTGYAVYKGMREPRVLSEFRREVWAQRRWFALLVAGTVLMTGLGGMVVADRFGVPMERVVLQMVPFFLVLVAFLLLSRYLQAVEQYAMQRTIPVEELAVGDVLAEPLELETPGRVEADPVEGATKWVGQKVAAVIPFRTPQVSERVATRVVGVTPEQLNEIQERYDAVAVKTGVRFIVSFPAAILLLATLGDPILYLISVTA